MPLSTDTLFCLVFLLFFHFILWQMWWTIKACQGLIDGLFRALLYFGIYFFLNERAAVAILVFKYILHFPQYNSSMLDQLLC